MTTATEILVHQIADRIDLDAEPTYRFELVYVHGNDDGLDAKTVEEILREGYSDGVDEWINDCQWERACDLADELFKEACDEDDDIDDHDLEGEWQSSHERYDLIVEIMERDTSDPYRDLLRQSNRMLFRVQYPEDDLVWLNADTLEGPAAGVCEALGLSLRFVEAVDEIQPEIAGYSAEDGDLFMAVWVFRASPSDLYAIREDADVEIDEPFLWLTNPWSGNGYGAVTTGQSVTVKMADIHTDSAAWGYGADDVFGGLCLDDSTITVKETT